MEDEIKAFADRAEHLAQMLRLSLIKRRGQKALGLKLRVELVEFKKEITKIKRMVLGNEK